MFSFVLSLLGLIRTLLTTHPLSIERDSPKSHFIVVAFLVVVSTLLALAALKHFGFDLSGTFNRSGVKGVVAVRPLSLSLSLL